MTQNEKIMKYLQDFGSITTMEAFAELGITRLASRIHELRKSGIRIDAETVTAKNRYGESVHFARYKAV